MSRYRIYIIFSVIVAMGLAGVFLVARGHYPIAVVDGDFISARQFMKEYRAASIYYQNLLKTYGAALNEEETLKPGDLQVAVINAMIEKSLIRKGAKREAGGDFNYLVENKLAKFAGDTELERVAQALYGLSGNEFVNSVLLPQAEREILVGRLYLRGEDVESWFSETKKKASVTIFSPNFEWNGEEVIGR